MKRLGLIALDLDGTLLDDQARIPPDNRRILRALAGQGVIIALTSGRMTDCISPFAEKLDIDCAIIACNGALVKARKTENRLVIYHNPLPAKYGDMLIDYCADHGFFLNYYLDDVLYAQKDMSLRKYAVLYSNQTGARYNFVKDLTQFKGKSPTKLILITDVANPNRIRTRDYQYQYFRRRLAGKVNLFRTNPEYLEFLKKGVDKGVGLKKLAEFYGIKRREIIAFGDGENDLEMLKYAGTGCALANAKEPVKEAADIVLKWDNNQAGVAKFLTEYL